MRELLPNIIGFDIEWIRYVDDIFAILPTSVDIEDFLRNLHSLHTSIKFKLETENNNCILFLDTLITRLPNNCLQFSVYRKPTHSNTYIHTFSNHSIKVKSGVITNMFLRAYKICGNACLEQEIKYINNIFLKHGYSQKFIEKAHAKARRRFYNVLENRPFLQRHEKLFVLPQTPKNNINLNKYLKDCAIVPVYRNSNTIRKLMCKPAKVSNTAPCIYSIQCKMCDKSYIGETINLERRLREHRESVRRGDNNSALFNHMNNANHLFDFDNTKKVTEVENTEKRKIIESILIQNSNTVNMYQSNHKLDKFTNEIVMKYVKDLSKLLRNLRPP